MRLIWKVLHRHLSAGQLAGFVLANITGLSIIVLGCQLYMDMKPVADNREGFLKPDYLVVSKPVTSFDLFSTDKPSFTDAEIEDIGGQPFVTDIGRFTPAGYHITGQLLVERLGVNLMTELFFESVPESFVDVESEDWSFAPGDRVVPIIIPRDYLNLYNFGYAPSSGFPAVPESVITKVGLDLVMTGNGQRLTLKGRIVGFSSRLNTILVPETFMQWSNRQLCPYGMPQQSSRLIVVVDNPADKRIAEYFKSHGYNIEGDKLNASKARWLMRVLAGVVMSVGIVICLLAMYILILSVFLLIQRNREAVLHLRDIGYSPQTVALPYQLIAAATNMLSVMTSISVMYIVRSRYLEQICTLMPDYHAGSTVAAWTVVLSIGVLMTACSALLFRRSVNRCFEG